MQKIELYIKNTKVDLSDNIRIVLDKVVSEYRNPTKKTGSYTYDLKLPNTNTNRLIFGNENNKQVIGKFRTSLPAEIRVNDIALIAGTWFPSAYTSESFEGAVIGENKGNDLKIVDLIDDKVTLRDIKSFVPINFSGDTTVLSYLKGNTTSPEICFPYVLDSFAKLNYAHVGLSYENFGVSHFTKAIVKNIFADAGYSVSGNVLSNFAYDKLTLLYSNENGEEVPYNYGTLAPVHCGTVADNTPAFVGTDTYWVYCATIKHGHDATGGVIYQGDLSHCLKEGIYTPKFTGFYDISFTTSVEVKHVNGNSADFRAYTVFRDITDGNEMDVVYDYTPYSSFASAKKVDSSVLIDVTGVTKTVKLEKNKQYAVQTYIAVPKTQASEPYHLVIQTPFLGTNLFDISACYAKTVLQPADFLPKIKQLVFIEAIFKMFNLYYTIDDAAKVINLYTRDDFYALNQSNIVDISDKISIESFKETPLSESDLIDTYYQYAEDDNDYFLAKTDYLSKVNPSGLTNVYTLPFAPLAFVQKPLEDMSGNTSNNFVPVAIPNTEVVDTSLLNDYEAEALFAYKPKVALYLGTGSDFYRDDLQAAWEDGKNRGNTFIHFPQRLSYSGGWSPILTMIPQLSFFNLSSQPAYQINTISATNEFYVTGATGTTVFQTNDLNFLEDADIVPDNDDYSLSTIGAKSIFQSGYKNNLKVNKYSNYLEGDIALNSFLYNQLNGRNIIKAEDDLYLLESIKGYDLATGDATLKLYKLIQ